jgi:hypothetical protein
MVTLFNREWSKADLLRHVGRMDQLAGIRLVEAQEGKARGSRLLDVWTGSGLRFQVNADRTLDISSCEFKGVPLSWRSPAGDIHPAYYEPQGTGWLRSFPGGLLTTCGLDQFGLPSQDGGTQYGLHGRISNTPTAQANYRTYWEGEEYILEISAETRQAALFAENLVLRRCISTALGSNRIQLKDEITNDGFDPTPHMLLYHFNLGFPPVSENTRLHLKTDQTQARDEAAQDGLDQWEIFQPPTPGYQEQVFIHRPVVDQQGIATVELSNPILGIGLRWSYQAANLPYLMEWKMMGEGAYVVGVEPANCNGLGGRAATRDMGQLPVLEPGENQSYQIDLEIITT